MHPTLVEYIWLDGHVPVRQMRSKTRALKLPENPKIEDFPEWSFDGSSTEQAVGTDSDCILKPVNFIKDPTRGEGNYLVMTEVFEPDGVTPHESNSRAQLRAVLEAGAGDLDTWMGFEQEYTIYEGVKPLGWPVEGYPGQQGPYYCGVGSKQIFGREFVEHHADVCIEAGLLFCGINAEVMPGQWEFQVGPRFFDNSEDNGVLNGTDHTWFARWLAHRVSEDYGYHISFENKPVKGDWNGAGMHTNFSTNETRDKAKGQAAIDTCIERLSKKHNEHIVLYGDKLEERLTGLHETADINTFSAGTADRGCSIRIPRGVAAKGYGYLEDRRPGANADPYLVAARICATIANVDESVMEFKSWPRKA